VDEWILGCDFIYCTVEKKINLLHWNLFSAVVAGKKEQN
jgi:hypothetical protein